MLERCIGFCFSFLLVECGGLHTHFENYQNPLEWNTCTVQSSNTTPMFSQPNTAVCRNFENKTALKRGQREMHSFCLIVCSVLWVLEKRETGPQDGHCLCRRMEGNDKAQTLELFDSVAWCCEYTVTPIFQ